MIYNFNKQSILHYLRQPSKTQKTVVLEAYHELLRISKHNNHSELASSKTLKNVIFVLIRERRRFNTYESTDINDISIELYFRIGLKTFSTINLKLTKKGLIKKLLNQTGQYRKTDKINTVLSMIMGSMPNDVRDNTTPTHKHFILNHIVKYYKSLNVKETFEQHLESTSPSNDSPSNDSPSNDSPSNDSPSNDSPSNDSPSNDSPSHKRFRRYTPPLKQLNTTHNHNHTPTLYDYNNSYQQYQNGYRGEPNNNNISYNKFWRKPDRNPDKLHNYKRSICKFYNTQKGCKYVNNCSFAHGENELRRRGPMFLNNSCPTGWPPNF